MASALAFLRRSAVRRAGSACAAWFVAALCGRVVAAIAASLRLRAEEVFGDGTPESVSLDTTSGLDGTTRDRTGAA